MPRLLGIHDIELLGILKITCEVVEDQETDRKFYFQKIQPSNISSCKANTGQWIKTDNADVIDADSNMPDYFRSSINRTADKKPTQVLKKKSIMSSVIVFFRN